MGTPIIPVKSDLANTLAKTLNSTPKKLDKLDGQKNGEISIRGLNLPNVIELDVLTGCWVNILIDNGDGKIGKGDLFLQGYPPYIKKNVKKGAHNHEFRFAKLFEPHHFQKKKKNNRSDPKLPFESKKLLKTIESRKGKPYDKTLFDGLKKTCKIK